MSSPVRPGDRRASLAQPPSANTTSVKVGESFVDRAVHDPFAETSRTNSRANSAGDVRRCC